MDLTVDLTTISLIISLVSLVAVLAVLLILASMQHELRLISAGVAASNRDIRRRGGS